MVNFLRRLVSGNKRRYSEHGFDLDLAFINCGPDFINRLLAMGYPSEGFEGLYRNNVVEVRRFLSHQAEESGGSYKVYNLTEEKAHHTSEQLGGSVARFPYADHQVPTLQMLWEFCRDLEAFLDHNDHNFAAIHCKAGKGRTGVMICAYLLYKGLVSNAEEAMHVYGQQRSLDGIGLTVESQRRWVRYFDASLREGHVPRAQPLTLQSISISGLPQRQLKNLIISVDTRDPHTGIFQHIAVISGNRSDVPTKSSIGGDNMGIEFTPLPSGSSASGEMEELKVEGDVRLEIYKSTSSARNLVCRVWMSTAYLSPGAILLTSQDLDKGARPVPKNMSVKANFGEATRSAMASVVSGTASELESLPICSPLASRHNTPSRFLTPIRTSQEVSRTTSSQDMTPHILDVHPDFSIPARYFPGSSSVTAGLADPGGLPEAGPSSSGGSSKAGLVPPLQGMHLSSSRNPFLAAVQETYTPLDSERSFQVNEQELSARLEHLADMQDKGHSAAEEDMESPFVSPSFMEDGGRSAGLSQQEAQISDEKGENGLRKSGSWVRGTAIKKAFTGNLKRVRWPSQWQDPELQDLSAPTTPSLPRHPGSMDWQSSPPYMSLSSSLVNMNNELSINTALRNDSSKSLLHGWESGVETPSHASQMIKWMSSSWWLTMA